MTARVSQPRLWPAVGAAAVVAGVAGFGLAKLTTKPPPAPAASSTPAPGQATAINVPAANLAIMQIAVEPVASGDLSAAIQAPGTVRPEPAGEAVITAQAAGEIVRVTKRLGDPVKAGEVLAQVASRDAAAMAADRRTAEAKATAARAALHREQSLYDQRVTPRQDLETAQANAAAAEAEAQRARIAASTAHVAADGRSLAVISPITGKVTAAGAALGAYVQPDAELFRVADPSRVQVEVALPAADAGRVKPDDQARITDAAGSSVPATVRSVTPTLNAETRSATAVLSFAPGAHAITPGEAVQVQISPTATGQAGAVVPEEAVQSVGGRDVVFVRTPTGFKVQPVAVGTRSGGRAAIASGLKPGQPIATRNAFLLKAELTKGTGEDEE